MNVFAIIVITVFIMVSGQQYPVIKWLETIHKANSAKRPNNRYQ